MHLFPNTRIFVSFGSLEIAWYAVLILTGALCAYLLCQRTMKKWGYAPEVLDDYVVPMLFIGILGARAWYVIFEWNYYSSHLNEIVAIWNGGLAIHGGLIAGTIFSLFFFKRRKISFLRMFDLIMPTVLLAQACGRWGNFMNQEAYGGIVSESFFAHYPAFIKNQMFIDGAYRMPTFLFESVCNLLGFLFITFIFRKHWYKRRGDCGFMYMVWYGITRFVIEGMRTDSLMVFGLRTAQLVSLALMVVGCLGLMGVFHKAFHWKKKPIVLFDLDGTLIDSQQLVFETFRRVFKELKPDYELSNEELYSFFGPTLEVTFSKYFPEDQVQSIIDRYQVINKSLHKDLLKEVPHAKEMLEGLKEQNIQCAVVSNKRIEVVKRGLKQAGLDGYFKVVLGKENLPEPKPSASGLIEACNLLHTSHDDCIYVGDNVADIVAAKNMAAYSVGFSVDEKQREALEKAHPCKVIDDLMQLVSLCKEDRIWSDNTIW